MLQLPILLLIFIYLLDLQLTSSRSRKFSCFIVLESYNFVMHVNNPCL
jgi:hypothetical protein